MFITTYFIRLFLTSIDEGKCKCSKSGLKTFIDIVNKIKIILFAIYIIIALSLPILLKGFMNENLQKIKDEFLKKKGELSHIITAEAPRQTLAAQKTPTEVAAQTRTLAQQVPQQAPLAQTRTLAQQVPQLAAQQAPLAQTRTLAQQVPQQAPLLRP